MSDPAVMINLASPVRRSSSSFLLSKNGSPSSRCDITSASSGVRPFRSLTHSSLYLMMGMDEFSASGN